MIGFIIISALLLCGVITLLAILFMRPSEVPISDKCYFTCIYFVVHQ